LRRLAGIDQGTETLGDWHFYWCTYYIIIFARVANSTRKVNILAKLIDFHQGSFPLFKNWWITTYESTVQDFNVGRTIKHSVFILFQTFSRSNVCHQPTARFIANL
jgi:hypothetical protein